MTLLGLNVSRVRMQHKLFVDPAALPKRVHVAVRAHGNFTEWVPLYVVMMLVIELGGGAKTPLWIAGGVLFTSRVIHAMGLLTKIPVAALGAAGTWLTGLWLGGWSVALGLGLL
jgi:uncharacterized membrane protein YecN with MAPEG domain